MIVKQKSSTGRPFVPPPRQLLGRPSTAWLLVGYLSGRRPFGALERWQTRYLPLYGAWAAVVVVVFPLVFGFA